MEKPQTSPRFALETEPDTARAQKLELLQNAILDNPELLSRALMLHVSVFDTMTSKKLLEMAGDDGVEPSFSEKNLEDAAKLWNNVDNEGVFPYIEFDADTEAAIDHNDDFNVLRGQWKNDENINGNKYTQRVRISRLTFFMGRVTALRSLETTTIK